METAQPVGAKKITSKTKKKKWEAGLQGPGSYARIKKKKKKGGQQYQGQKGAKAVRHKGSGHEETTGYLRSIIWQNSWDGNKMTEGKKTQPERKGRRWMLVCRGREGNRETSPSGTPGKLLRGFFFPLKVKAVSAHLTSQEKESVCKKRENTAGPSGTGTGWNFGLCSRFWIQLHCSGPVLFT